MLLDWTLTSHSGIGRKVKGPGTHGEKIRRER